MSDDTHQDPPGPPNAAAAVRSKTGLATEIRRHHLAHGRRTGRPLKKAALAKKISVSISSLYAYLNGTTLIPADILDRLLDALDVPTPERQRLSTARDMLDLGGMFPDPDREPVPRQLPGAVRGFVGRGAELLTLGQLLDNAAEETNAVVISAIDGAAGIGKTALAVHWAHQVKDRFPDGQLYVNLRGFDIGAPLSPGQALHRILQALGFAAHAIPADLDAKTALYRSRLAGKHVLVLLDNARSAKQILPLLPGSPTCMVLVTSRTMLATVDGTTHLHLDVLSEPEALAMLGQLAGVDRVRAEPDAARTLVSLCARLPLAVRIAGARLSTRPSWPIRALVRRLADAQHRLDELQLSDRALRSSFAVSYHALSGSDDTVDQTAAHVFRLLGVLDWVDMSIPVAAALLDLPQPRTQAALERLVDDHLLDSESPGRYQTHDLLRLYARELAHQDEPDSARRTALYRALTCYLAAAEQATLLLHPLENRRIDAKAARGRRGGFPLSTLADARAWADAERPNLLAATRQAAAAPGGDPGVVVQLGAALYRPFDTLGHWQDLITILQLAADVASRTGDRHGEAQAREDAGYLCGQVGSADEAISHGLRALAIWREIGNRIGEESCLGILGTVYKGLGRLDEAMSCLQQGLAICREIGYSRGEPHILTNLGLVHHRMGQYDQAIDCQQQALDINREVGDRLGEAVALCNLAWAYSRAGRAPHAAVHHRKSLEIFQEIGHRYGEAEQLWGLGQACEALGDHEQARTHWHQSITLLRAIGALAPTAANTLLRQDVPDTPEIIQSNI